MSSRTFSISNPRRVHSGVAGVGPSKERPGRARRRGAERWRHPGAVPRQLRRVRRSTPARRLEVIGSDHGHERKSRFTFVISWPADCRRACHALAFPEHFMWGRHRSSVECSLRSADTRVATSSAGASMLARLIDDRGGELLCRATARAFAQLRRSVSGLAAT